ncbi:nucleotide-binding domain-containing protein [Acinetobacter sp. WCHA29]|uniref:nucleotide-binding domain-containing protein n=1 Tax=Acinetobacter sp. WCHA29 TaxID=2004649 RepID=UPI000B3D31EB|nr:adenylate/guanylate cyclase domain-containing protein [Acinetobacter sp. WCHA29]
MSFDFSISDFEKIVYAEKNTVPMMDSIGFDSSMVQESYSDVQKSVSNLNESLELTINEPEQYKLQLKIREAFGLRNSINMGRIADHPDFKDLVNGGQRKHYITTMFVDIKGSTKLSLKYPNDLEFIYKFKNAVIKSCIEVIHAFDGHVHRIMGDAVLGFFGSTKREISRSQSILDCLNAGSMLTVILEQTIKPWLKQQKSDFDVLDFGFRVGCNFGDTDDVLWANYGFGHVGEVSPTGLPVDLAAKLQGLASKNNIMMGQGLLEFFNFPHDFSEIKKVIENGVYVEKKFIYNPNYTKADGSKLNYIMRSLKTHKYILGLPLPLELKSFIAINVSDSDKIIPNNKFNLSAKLVNPNTNHESDYYSNSKVIQKKSKIKAVLTANSLNFGEMYKVIFYKKNNSGFNDEEILKQYLEEEEDSQELKGENAQSIAYFFTTKEFKRDCSFKGLHYIKCEVIDKKGSVVFRDYIYVPIE